MEAKLEMIEEPKKPISMNPKLFAMWLFMGSIFMLFAAFTSAYIVRQAEGNWVQFDLPSLLWITSGVIVLSSVTIQWAYFAAKKDNLDQVKILTLITTILGIAFAVGQLYAWSQMVDNNIYLVGNPSGSFVYILTGLHGAHVLGGIIYLLIVLVSTFRYHVHSKNMNQLTMCVTYWHFLGGLWLYLFIFLLLNR